jgi:hypothetical protein
MIKNVRNIIWGEGGGKIEAVQYLGSGAKRTFVTALKL